MDGAVGVDVDRLRPDVRLGGEADAAAEPGAPDGGDWWAEGVKMESLLGKIDHPDDE